MELADRSERELALGINDVRPADGTLLSFPSRWVLLAAMVAALAIATVFLFSYKRQSPPRVDNISSSPVAIVTNLSNTVWTAPGTVPKTGDYLVVGADYHLKAGNMDMRFMNGAEITLRGPVDFTIRSELELFVSHGSVAADIPGSAHGFTILTPNAAFVDLGTRFSINVSENGEPTSDLLVKEGLVIANLLGDNGTTVSGVPTKPGASLRVNSSGFSYGVTAPETFLEPPAIKENQLAISTQYREVVRASQPLGYWTFEESSGKTVINEMGREHNGRFSGAAKLAQAGGNTSLRFGNTNIPSNFHISKAFEGLNRGQGYSIELWFNAETRRHATIATLHSPRTPDQIVSDHFGKEVPYLSQLEILGENTRAAGLICGDFSLRQVHRAPAGGTAGTNAITSAVYQAHRWYHLVAVVNPDEVILYLDGNMVRRVSHQGIPDESPFLLSVGRLRPEGYPGTYRQFDGRIDELALYGRPLTEEEILRHWKTGEAGVQEKN